MDTTSASLDTILFVERKRSQVSKANHAARHVHYDREQVRHAKTFQDAIELLPSVDHVVTDLYVPSGNIGTEELKSYIDQFLPDYASFAKHRFREKRPGKIFRFLAKTAKQIFASEGDYTTIEKLEESIYPHRKHSNKYSDLDVVTEYCRKDHGQYIQFLQIMESVKAGKMLPLGIIIAEKAYDLNIPCSIVNSLGPKDNAFLAIKDKILVPYAHEFPVDRQIGWYVATEDAIKPHLNFGNHRPHISH